MNPIIKPWPFRGWGMDMIGKIHPPSSKGHVWVLAITDYFTKWVEAVPMKAVAASDVVDFVREHVIHRFGIPQDYYDRWRLVFVSKEFRKFCEDMGIKSIRSSPYYAQANGHAEASNKSLIKLIKRKIDEHPRRWHEKIKENKAKVARAYNKKVKPKEFQVGDLLDGVKFPVAVNGQHLKKYFPSMWDDEHPILLPNLRAVTSLVVAAVGAATGGFFVADEAASSVFILFVVVVVVVVHRPASASERLAPTEESSSSGSSAYSSSSSERSASQERVLLASAPSPLFVRRCLLELRRPANLRRVSAGPRRAGTFCSLLRALHSCFFVTFTASPSTVLVATRESVPSPVKVFLSDRAQGQGPSPSLKRSAGTCRKRALDSFDPDPYVFWKDLKMGKTPAARLGRSPPKPTGSSDDLTMLEIHEHVPPLRAPAG
ncbi:hypothetical protein QYE76_064096 [Lolium multiflorum]|uniref:Integrase catalytic domain-containing protein n=1 Tax=Lolium multiflorum TaxID=4521 RepID=A0AAD8W7B3_LOLMU|nr:hypothetical protein QYE76_064096 [Lolium multiflorum]